MLVHSQAWSLIYACCPSSFFAYNVQLGCSKVLEKGILSAICSRDACLKFMALCKKRQEAGLWIEELDLAAAEAGLVRPEAVNGPEKHDTWSEVQSELGDNKMEEVYDDGSVRSQANYHGEGRGYFVEESSHSDVQRRRGLQNDSVDINGDISSSYRVRGKPHQQSSVHQQHLDEGAGANYAQEGSGRYYSDDGLVGPRPSLWQQQAAPPPLKPPSVGKFTGSRLPNEPGYPDHAIPGDYRDAETGRLIRPRGTWSVQSPRQMPNYAHMSDAEAYESRPQYEASSRGNRGLAPGNYHGNQTGMQDGYFQQDQINDQHLSSAWQQPTHYNWQQSLRHLEGPGYASRAPPQGHADTQPSNEADYAGGTPANSSDWQAATPTKGQLTSKNDGHNPGPSYESSSKDLQSPTDVNNNRRLARRSSSPKRRSPSPMKRIQIGRNGQRRPGMVVIRNINYITSNSQDRSAEKDRNPKGSDEDEKGESDLETDSEGESLQRKAQSVRMSVQDAISLFEGKKREPGHGSKKKSGKKDTRRGSIESGGSLASQRSSFKRWSGVSDASSDQSQQVEDAQDISSGEVQSQLDQQMRSGDDAAFMSGKLATNPYPSEARHIASSGDGGTMWSADQFEAEFSADNVVPQKSALEDFSMYSNRDGRDSRSGESSYYNVEELQATNKSVQAEDVSMVLPARESSDVSRNLQQSGDIEEHQGTSSRRRPVADDSFILGDRAEPTKSGHAPDSRTLNPGELDFSLKDESQGASLYSAVDDSFMILARPPSQQDQVQNSWRTTIDMEPEPPTDRHRYVEAGEDSTKLYEPEDVFMIPERNANRDSIGRAWSDYDLAFGGERQQPEDDADVSAAGDVGSPKSEKGRFYDKYRERRDAKLREESGPKRAERDAKLKAMQEVLERRKAEMTARVGRTTERGNSLADAQARADKLRAYKAGLARSKKEKVRTKSCTSSSDYDNPANNSFVFA